MPGKMKQIGIGLIVGAVVACVLGGIKYLQISSAIAEQMAMAQPPTAVTSVVVQEDAWNSYIEVVGTISAVQGTTLAVELAGTVTTIHFESGDAVEKGAKLVELDTKVEQANLRGARAAAEEAQKLLKRARVLRDKNANSVADLDAAIARAAEATARVAALESTIEKKTITAPFAGRTGIRKVNPGQYVTEGTEIVPLFALDTLYVDFSLPQSTIGQVAPGAEILVTSDSWLAPVTGTVQSLDPNVDSQTRNYGIRAVIDNLNGPLRPGMFVDVKVDTGTRLTVIPVPQSSIVYAPYGNSIWIIENKEAEDGPMKKFVTQQFVKLGDTRGDLIAVLDGLQDGMEIVSSGGFKLQPGAAVVVNNSVTPTAAENPQPDNS